MGWLQRYRESRRWRYVGTAEGITQYIGDDGKVEPGGHRHTYWVLSERGDGKRCAKRVGRQHGSTHSIEQEAAVEAWLLGGPLPELTANPERPGRKADLVVFPGGKDGAA